MNYPSQIFRQLGCGAGYTLEEAILVIAIISMLFGSAFLILTNAQRSTPNTKLMRDVATLNQAVLIYRTSGSTVNGLADPQDVLDRLKTKMKAENAPAMAGLRKGMVDPRLAVRLQTSVEGSNDDQRAHHTTSTKSFQIASSGGQGIKEFLLEESLVLKDYGKDNRKSSFDLAQMSNWVWHYTDQNGPAKTGLAGGIPTVHDANSGKPGTSSGARQLNIHGSSPNPAGGKLSTLSLNNASSIPVSYQIRDYFNAKWTKDRTNPLASGTATTVRLNPNRAVDDCFDAALAGGK